MKRHKLLAIILGISAISLVFTACVKDSPSNGAGTTIALDDNVVYITNEGNFQAGNASVSAYNSSDSTVVEDLFSAANNLPLGDVCQSIRFHLGKSYVVVNNSGKVEVVNDEDFSSIGTISGLTSPRYLLPVSQSKAYVTDFKAQQIAIVDLNTLQKTGSIPCTGWTEEAHLIYGKAFVTNSYREKLYVINTSNDVLVDSISIGYGANSIVEDASGMLWVLCGGDVALNKPASLHRINPASHSVEQSFVFANTNDTPWRLRINASYDTLYYLNKDVYRMPIVAAALPNAAFIAREGRLFHGLGVHPQTGDVFVSDAIDYSQRGRIYHYQADGVLKRSFLAGVIPGDFFFQ